MVAPSAPTPPAPARPSPARSNRPGRRRPRPPLPLVLGLLVGLPLGLPLGGLGPSGSPGLAQTTWELELYRQRLQRQFQHLDRDGNGRLEAPEVRGNAYMERHFQRLDRGNNGYLRQNDVVPSHPEVRRERVRAFFSEADRNGDGRIDRREAQAYPWLQRRFGAGDADGDGGLSPAELGQLRRRSAGE